MPLSQPPPGPPPFSSMNSTKWPTILNAHFLVCCPCYRIARQTPNAEMDYHLRIGSQIFGVAGIALLAVTSILVVGWPRPFLLGAVVAAVGILLEGLQFLTPDRTPQLMGAFYSALGAVAAALAAEYVIREDKDEQPQ